MISKALVVAAYRRKCELIAELLAARGDGSRLTVFVPPHWGGQQLESTYANNYDLRVIPIRLSGNYHLHHYPTLAAALARLKPDVLHIDEEPYNLATYLALRAAKKINARTVFFSWQNIHRQYPPPFRWMERWVLQNADAAMVGSREAQQVWRRKYDRLATHIVPQFGVDEAHFCPTPPRLRDGRFVLGYAGRLVHEKGVDVLLNALATMPNVRAIIIGEGDQLSALQTLAHTLHIAERVEFRPPLPSTRIREFYHQIDALALPSRTLPNWKEQFGRVLIEAMSCGVPVIGSSCGEIPHVIGDAGLTFAEDDVHGLHTAIQQLANDERLCENLSHKGRQRVLDHFTMRHIAKQTVAIYQIMVN